MLRVTDVYSSGILSRHTMALFGLPKSPLQKIALAPGPALTKSVDGHDFDALDALDSANTLHWSIVRKAADCPAAASEGGRP